MIKDYRNLNKKKDNITSQFQSIMLVKGCLELLLVFINYKEDTNSILVVKAIHTVDLKHGR